MTNASEAYPLRQSLYPAKARSRAVLCSTTGLG